MTPEKWHLVTDMFHAALAKRGPDERAAFLADACAGDGELRAEVDGMLAAHRDAGSFGDEPVFGGADVAPDPDRVETDAAPYRIVRRIGEGGMGVVYEAEQESPVRRTVAPKLIRAGFASEQALPLAVAALVGGSVVATVGFIRARTAEANARVAAAKAVAINDFLKETLAAADPQKGRERDVTVREAIASASKKAEAALRDQPEILGAVLNTIGQSFLGLGSYDDAEPILRRALQIRRGPGIPPRDLGESLMSLGSAVFDMGKYADAEQLFREALATYRKAGDSDLLLADSLNDLAMTLERKDRDYAAAGRLLEDSLAIRTRILGELVSHGRARPGRAPLPARHGAQP